MQLRVIVTRRTTASAALAVVALLSLGCPPDYSQTCRFDGDDSKPCGMCIAKSCQASVDACCDDKYACRDDMGKVDTCGRGGGCTSLASSNGFSGPKLNAIATCIATYCTSACGATGVSSAGNRISCRKTTAGCSCTSESGTGSGFSTSCSTAQVSSSSTGTALCCASPSWPAVGTACSCTIYPDACPSGLEAHASCD